MKQSTITINVQMDEKTFKRFALFDTFVRLRRWRSPAAFAAILLLFSAVAFALVGRAEQAALIGWLLLLIALLLPAAYFLHYYLQLNGQVRRLNIKKPRPAYFVTVSEEGVRIVNNMAKEEPLVLSWADIHAVYRRRDCLYLYRTENRAFILPIRDMSSTLDTLWDTFAAHLPKEKLHA